MKKKPVKILLLDSEQAFLRGFVLAIQPASVLEIGAAWGGSASIIVDALPKDGRLTSIDRDPKPECIELFTDFKNASLIIGDSSSAIAQTEGQFEIAFIDGDHTYDGVLRDIRGVLPRLAPKGWLLFHDAHNEPVARAIDVAVKEFSLIDVGLVTTAYTTDADGTLWGGLRLCRCR